MTRSARVRSLLPTFAVAFAALFLVDVEARAAANVPPLASTPQYKAFSQFVAKLHEMRTTPATPQRKTELESTLTTRHNAVVAKATALFQRAKQIAKNKAQARYAAQAAKVRATEARELSSIRQEAAVRAQRALTSYNRGIAAVDSYYDGAGARLRKALNGARKRLAKATDPLAQQQLKVHIASLERQLADNDQDKERALKRLRTRYLKEKRAIEATRAQEAESVLRSDQAMIESLRRSRDRTFSLRVASLQAKRETQLAGLEDKLDAGRLSIALMPTAPTS